jgi:hypothetical protein
MNRFRNSASHVLTSLLGSFVLVFGLWVPVSALAQSKTETPSKKSKTPAQLSGSEKGVFKILVENDPKGTEEFEIAPSGNQFVTRSKIQLTVIRGEKPVQYLIESELVLKPNFEPVRYRMVQKYEGNIVTAKMDFQPEETKAEFNTGAETELREYKLAPDVALLDDNVFCHYILLARRYDYDRGGLQEFSAFIPQESVGGVLRMMYKGDEIIQVGGKALSVQHLVIDTSDLKLDLYVEGENHRMVKLEVPSSNVVVERVD